MNKRHIQGWIILIYDPSHSEKHILVKKREERERERRKIEMYSFLFGIEFLFIFFN